MATLTKKISIKINGKEYKEYNFLNIVLIQELLTPNELRFTMQKKLYVVTEDSCNFVIPRELLGAKVTLQIETSRFDERAEEKNESIEFTGIIDKIDIYREQLISEQLIDVIAYTPEYVLIDHPHCMSYEDMTLKNIVTKTLDPYSIANEINPRTKESIPYTVQYNENNHQFLARLAQRYGEWMYHNGEKWIFGEVMKKKSMELYAKTDILSYSYEIDLFHHSVTHAHHDYLKYENLVKSDTEYSELAKSGFHILTDEAKKKSASLFTKKTFQNLHCCNPEENDIDELDVSLKAKLFGEKATQTVCVGTSVRADFTLGTCFKIKDLFHNDKGKSSFETQEELMICRVVHKAAVNGEYQNSFRAISSKSEYPPYSNSSVFVASPAQRAKVKDNKDEEKLGRIRVQFLWQEEQDSNLMTPWIRIAQPHGGDDKGFYFIPEIDEEVIVDFENSNAEKPYVVGTLFHGKQHPGKEWPNDENEIKAIRTRNGHTIEIHDEGNDGYIYIYDHEKKNYEITFSTDKKLIELKSTGDIKLLADNDIIMEAGNDMKIKVGNNKDVDVKNNLSIHASTDIKVKADSNINQEAGANFEQKAGSSMKISSTNHDQKANASMKLDGGGMLEAKGGMVKIN